jgi:hypothetical protein
MTTPKEVREATLRNIHAALSDLINEPPRVRNTSHDIDVAKIRETLKGIRPFWEVYCQTSGASRYGMSHIGEYGVMYLTCCYWFTLLSQFEDGKD